MVVPYATLWEHIVLNEIHAARQERDVRYWRDKQGHEIDFVLPGRRGAPLAVECKWKAAAFDPANLLVFRNRYPQGVNLVVASDVDRPYTRTYRGVKVRYEALGGLIAELDGVAPAA